MGDSALLDLEERAAVPVRGGQRVTSLDFVRGVAMILMAIDHVRVYSGVPAWGFTFGVFFTRWVTNFAAPTFVFLAGTSAYLRGKRLGSTASLSRLLWVRGAWLILLELTVLRLSWTFNIDFAHYMLAGVIWMIGWSMILLAAAVYLPVNALGIIGVCVVVLHNVADLFRVQIENCFGNTGPNWLLKFLYFGGQIHLGTSGPPLYVLYVIVPWVGLMFAGYAFGRITEMSQPRRKRIYLTLGIALTTLFIVLRVFGRYGDPRPWEAEHTLFGFLSTTKYPASLEFLLMTMGPMFVLWALAEGWKGLFASIIETFGRVPLFFYLIHIPLIHAMACAVSLIREGHVNPWLFANQPVAPGPAPESYAWSLGLLYAVYALCLVILYFPCRWFARLKQRNKTAWFSFL